MNLGFLVAQFERVAPTLQGGIIGILKFFEQLRVLYGRGRLMRKDLCQLHRFTIIDSARVAVQSNITGDLSARDHRNSHPATYAIRRDPLLESSIHLCILQHDRLASTANLLE